MKVFRLNVRHIERGYPDIQTLAIIMRALCRDGLGSSATEVDNMERWQYND